MFTMIEMDFDKLNEGNLCNAYYLVAGGSNSEGVARSLVRSGKGKAIPIQTIYPKSIV
jgi:hypothetical protein